MYSKGNVERLLAILFTGAPASRDNAVEPGMPKAERNPAELGDEIAERIDIDNAWFGSMHRMSNPAALYLRYGNAVATGDIAKELEMTTEEVELSIESDLDILVKEINGEVMI